MAGFFLPMQPYHIVYYRGFGSPGAVWLTGRVLRRPELPTPADRASFWENLTATMRRFLTDEVGGIQVRIEAFGQTFHTLTNDEGYFDITIDPDIDLPAGRAWFPVRYVLEGVHQPGSGEAVVKDGQLMIAPAYSQFGVISDIDDTVLVTEATNLWQAVRLTFLENAFSRLPFAGVAAFYRALQSGAVTTLFNPIYYVSSSPWNLYDLLVDFFRIQGIPKGPLLLRDIGLNANLLASSGHHTHKRAMIDKILAVNPDLPFVLLGDSGQQDPEIYADVIRANPGRIRAVYIRDVSTDDRRDAAVQQLIAAAADYNVPMLLVADTVAAAEHAAALGLIDPDALPEIRADRRADKEGA
jgi:phosphatidate phosphatase APP1